MSDKKAKILFVEDDVYLSFVTRDNLEIAGYEIILTDNGREAFDIFLHEKIDLCLLDVMLEEMDGFTLARKIRETNKDVPILFLTAKSLKEDKIEGLRLGADDYITKPFSIEELIFKIEIFLKRSRISYTRADEVPLLQLNSFTLDFDNLTLKHSNNQIRLTRKEAELLRYLVLNKNKIVKKEQILSEVWGNDDYYTSRSLDVFISRLRKYIKPDPDLSIENIHGVGFRLNCND